MALLSLTQTSLIENATTGAQQTIGVEALCTEGPLIATSDAVSQSLRLSKQNSATSLQLASTLA
jgi:hypothetical protein